MLFSIPIRYQYPYLCNSVGTPCSLDIYFLEVHLSKYNEFKFRNPSIIFQEAVWHVNQSFFAIHIFTYEKYPITN